MLLKEMGALSGRRGEERASIGGKRREAKRKKAKIKTQELQVLNAEELERLCKVYEVMINAKVKKV